jgi:hypothetical protein
VLPQKPWRRRGLKSLLARAGPESVSADPVAQKFLTAAAVLIFYTRLLVAG